MFKAQVIERLVVTAHAAVFRGNLRQLLHIVAVQNPGFAQTGKPFLKVDFYIGVASRSSASASIEMGCFTFAEVDISICHLQVSQSVATKSAATSSICRNSEAPIPCDVS